MSDDPRGGAPRDPAGTADPDAALVRDFFARERTAAPTLGADPARWQEIVEASARSRRPWLRYAAGAAAAAVVLGAVGVATLGRGGTTAFPVGPVLSSSVVGSSPPSPRPTSSSVPTPTPSTSTPVSPSPPPSGAPVPASFAVRSLTTGAPGHLFALGTVACPGGQCPALAGSSDNGASWSLRHTFAASTAAPGSTPGRLGGAGTLTQVRFASASLGWVFGGAAMRTTDGGATWQDYPHPGGEVIGLETDGTDVVLTAAQGCTDGTCHGAISVVRAPVTADSATDVAGTIDGGSGVQDAQISWQGGQAFVSPVVVPVAGRPAPTRSSSRRTASIARHPPRAAPDRRSGWSPQLPGRPSSPCALRAPPQDRSVCRPVEQRRRRQLAFGPRRAAPARQRGHDLLRCRRRPDPPRRLRRESRRPRLDAPQQGRRRHLAPAKVGAAAARPRVGVGRRPRRRDVLRPFRRRLGRLLEEQRPG